MPSHARVRKAWWMLIRFVFLYCCAGRIQFGSRLCVWSPKQWSAAFDFNYSTGAIVKLTTELNRISSSPPLSTCATNSSKWTFRPNVHYLCDNLHRATQCLHPTWWIMNVKHYFWIQFQIIWICNDYISLSLSLSLSANEFHLNWVWIHKRRATKWLSWETRSRQCCIRSIRDIWFKWPEQMHIYRIVIQIMNIKSTRNSATIYKCQSIIIREHCTFTWTMNL